MKKLFLLFMVLMLANACTWKRNLTNEIKRTARITVTAGECYRDFHSQSLMTATKFINDNAISSSGVEYLLKIADQAQIDSVALSEQLDLLKSDEVKSSAVEKALNKLKASAAKVSSAIIFFLANEGVSNGN